MSDELRCYMCGKPIEQNPETAEPHVRIAIVDPAGVPVKGKFRAFHVPCSPWWADDFNRRTGGPK